MVHWRLTKALDRRISLANSIVNILEKDSSYNLKGDDKKIEKNIPDKTTNKKVFCIGLSKTGTTSLSKALAILGFNCSHYPLNSIQYIEKRTYLTKLLNFIGYKIFSYPLGISNYRTGSTNINISDFSQFNAFADIPISFGYKTLDNDYPGSKFILTIRDIEPWLRSCKKHMYRPYRPGRPKWWDNREMGEWHENNSNKINRLNYDMYGSPCFDERLYRATYQRHLEDVQRYFAGREKDLLIIDITSGSGWEVICNFLEKPIPKEPFPFENITKVQFELSNLDKIQPQGS